MSKTSNGEAHVTLAVKNEEEQQLVARGARDDPDQITGEYLAIRGEVESLFSELAQAMTNARIVLTALGKRGERLTKLTPPDGTSVPAVAEEQLAVSARQVQKVGARSFRLATVCLGTFEESVETLRLSLQLSELRFACTHEQDPVGSRSPNRSTLGS